MNNDCRKRRSKKNAFFVSLVNGNRLSIKIFSIDKIENLS